MFIIIWLLNTQDHYHHHHPHQPTFELPLFHINTSLIHKSLKHEDHINDIENHIKAA